MLCVTLASTEAYEKLIYAMAAGRALSRRIADARKQDISRQPGVTETTFGCRRGE